MAEPVAEPLHSGLAVTELHVRNLPDQPGLQANPSLRPNLLVNLFAIYCEDS